MAEAADATPVSTAAVDAALARLAYFPALVLAVSGGADSTASMHLVADWLGRTLAAKPSVLVVTVDHGLREGSAREAAEVARAAAALGFPHVTIRHVGARPEAFSQDWARDLRYRLLARAARQRWPEGRVAIVTAHTADDQAETVLMRLARGSGIDGLAGIPPERRFEVDPGITLLRPLIAFRKSELVGLLESRGVGWIEDPSNEDARFERVRLRQLDDARRQLGLTSEALARTARRAMRAREALDDIAGAVLADPGVCRLDALAFAEVDWAALLRQPPEIRLRVLRSLIGAVGGLAEAVSLSTLEAMTEARGWQSPAGLTLGRVVVAEGREGLLEMTREFGREPLPRIDLQPFEPVVWDGRFIVRQAQEWPGHRLEVGALGREGLAIVERACPAAAKPRRALWSLPAIYLDGQLAGVPSLGFEAGAGPAGVTVAPGYVSSTARKLP